MEATVAASWEQHDPKERHTGSKNDHKVGLLAAIAQGAAVQSKKQGGKEARNE
jgi:hypothetical protein